MTNRSEKEMLVCGFETRKVKGKDHWVGLLHLLDENLQKWTKIIDSGFASSDLSHHASEIPLGTEVKVNERNLKPYRGGWRSQFSGGRHSSRDGSILFRGIQNTSCSVHSGRHTWSRGPKHRSNLYS